MAQLTLRIANRDHLVACRDGEEPHLLRLAAIVNRNAETALRASGGDPERTMLYLALLTADRLEEAERNPPEGVPPYIVDYLAERLEAVASALEEELPNA